MKMDLGPSSLAGEAPSPDTQPEIDARRPTYPDLKDAVVVVTGAGQGIGLAIAQRFAQNGSAVVLADRNETAAQEAAAAIRSDGGRSLALAVDATDAGEVDRLFEVVHRELGPPYTLVNNVGYVQPYAAENSILKMSPAAWDEILATNLTSAFLCTRAAAPLMVERKRGSIINIASNNGRIIDTITGSHYCAAKAGLLHFTRHVALELAQHGVRVNALSPGVTETPRSRGFLTSEIRERIMALTPLGRTAQPEEIAGAALFLASADASYITGATLDVAGGRVML